MATLSQETRTFIANVRKVLEHENISLAEIYRKTDFMHPYLSQLLGGKKGNPQIDTCGEIARALGVSLSDLLEPEFDPARSTPKVSA